MNIPGRYSEWRGAIFKFAADTRKMPFRLSVLCGAASDAVDAVKLEIPQGY